MKRQAPRRINCTRHTGKTQLNVNKKEERKKKHPKKNDNKKRKKKLEKTKNKIEEKENSANRTLARLSESVVGVFFLCVNENNPYLK